MNPRARAVAVIFAAVSLAGVAGCGLPNDDRPREIAADRVPFNLLAPTASTPSATDVPGTALIATVYFVASDRLEGVERDVTTRDITAALTALLGGPVDNDPPGLTTTIPTETRLLSAAPDAADPSVLVINLSQEFFAVVGQDQLRGYAQLVYTATESETIHGVRFQNAGQDVQALTEGGVLKAGAVTRADYLSLQPAPKVTPPTATTVPE